MSGLVDKIYLNAPSVIKNILITIYGRRNNSKRFGEYYRVHYQELMKNLSYGREQLESVQLDKLKSLLSELHQYSTYFKKVIDEIGGLEEILSKKNVSSILCQIPILEKDFLRSNMGEILNTNPHRLTCTKTNTSGTTGSPMTVEVDEESLQITFAQWERYYRWIGLPDRFKSVRLSGRIIIKPDKKNAPFWVYNGASQQLFMSTYHLLPENIYSYIKKLNNFKPELIDGYPSAIYTISKFINDNKINLSFKPLAISTTAETLHDYQREEIEKAFRCKVYNQYASSEGAPWIVECKCGTYHLWTDTGVFEFINVQDIDENTQSADLVVTSFRSLKTPLIRYNIGDTVLLAKSNDKCKCGSDFPTIKGIIGRQEDILYTNEKGFVGRMDTAYKGLEGIFKSKIIQTAINEIDVLIIPTKQYNKKIESELKKNLMERLGNIKINIKLVDEIPLGKNGKFKAVENLMLEREKYDKDRSFG